MMNACGMSSGHEPCGAAVGQADMSLVALRCGAGQARLAECDGKGGGSVALPAVMESWRPQRHKTFCGPASLAILLASIASGSSVDEDDILTLAERGRRDGTRAGPPLPTDAKVRKSGMSLAELEAVATHLPLGDKGRRRGVWQRLHAGQANECGGIGDVDQLRRTIVDTLERFDLCLGILTMTLLH